MFLEIKINNVKMLNGWPIEKDFIWRTKQNELFLKGGSYGIEGKDWNN